MGVQDSTKILETTHLPLGGVGFCVPWTPGRFLLVLLLSYEIFTTNSHGNLRVPTPPMPRFPQEIAGHIKGLWKPIGFP